MAVIPTSSKRGIFYSATAVLLLLFLIYALNFSTAYTYRQEMFVAKNRVLAMDTLLDDIERDMGRALYIIGFRTLLAMQQHIVAEGQYLNDTSLAFEEAFLNGTIGGEPQLLLNQSTFVNWTQKLGEQAGLLGFTAVFEMGNVTLTQEDPWHVTVGITARVNLTDSLGTAGWNTTLTVSRAVSILDFEDPLYTMNSEGKVANTIRQSPYEGDFVTGSDTTNLRLHINGSFYIASTSAPDYLSRLEGNLSNASAGIESMVNLIEFQVADLGIEDRSAIDYIYFGTADLSNVTFKVNNTFESWFRIDNTSGHLETYGVTNLTFT